MMDRSLTDTRHRGIDPNGSGGVAPPCPGADDGIVSTANFVAGVAALRRRGGACVMKVDPACRRARHPPLDPSPPKIRHDSTAPRSIPASVFGGGSLIRASAPEFSEQYAAVSLRIGHSRA
jgi:hypothetical protein